ncbi:hypothetical protein VNO78_01144 [Psophocarpus tetragonolobus]|uniref:Lachrymatory factor synthase n=1 Tax=Psophocarpus tetragonolobus TaxID=3891 RepID=A0AAN9T048_PSOTE
MTEEKWQGKAVAELAGTDAELVWEALEDFCNLHKWMPIETCYQVEGVAGEPGLIRYCASSVQHDFPVSDSANTTTIKWAKEKLLAIDPVQRSLSYEIVDNNVGFASYVATIKVLPIHSHGSQIEWAFLCDPIQGWTIQDLKSYLHSSLHFMANKLQLAHPTHSTQP